ncbi:N-acetyltransferase [Sphingomonas paeninsulae]|uniref:N-acetyltransferase n=1 Tax=Sphingomonas paeninsulae TaxID=2319844 RepID=A0A494TFH6_SPHPE|nr:GNAT family N-acetyltransferase [Sphingomonas paeninsulae]AYJ86114.1 N-acetyltransferase [Sphingomonas paeninsulae]
MTAIAPSIVTQRLVLRAHRVEDHPACAALWGNNEVTRFIGGVPKSSQEAWFRILQYTGSWQLIGYGLWAICDRESGILIGEGGFSDFRRGIVALEGAPEIGWAFAQQAWGSGIASEAVSAMVAWVDVNLIASETRCLISDGNAASVKVATRNGYVACADLPDEARVFRRLRQAH